MIVGRWNNARICPSSNIGQYNFDGVKQFECLGTTQTGNDETAKEIETKIQTGIKKFLRTSEIVRILIPVKRSK